MAMQVSRMMPGPRFKTKAGGAREARLSGLGAVIPGVIPGVIGSVAAAQAAAQPVVTGPNAELELERLRANTQLELAQMRMASDITTSILQAGGQVGQAYMMSEAQIKAIEEDRKARMAEMALRWQAIGAGQLPPVSLRMPPPVMRPAISPIFILAGAGLVLFLLMR